jgi:valyl-tRNA synthetase
MQKQAFSVNSVLGRDELDRWLDNVRDWCLSRQLWWGHRIPMACPEAMEDSLVSGSRENLDAWRPYTEDMDPSIWHQDPDVLDTWFSSALLPLSTQTTISRLPSMLPPTYPLPWLETGADILFFWAARMMLLCTHLSGGVLPFKSLLLHPVLRDAHGRKLSKSIGNSLDPIVAIDGQSVADMQATLAASVSLPASEKEAFLKQVHQDFPDGMPTHSSDMLRHAILSYSLSGSYLTFDALPALRAAMACHIKLQNVFIAVDRTLKEHQFTLRRSLNASIEVALGPLVVELCAADFPPLAAFFLNALSDLSAQYTAKMDATETHAALDSLVCFLRDALSARYLPLCRTALAHPMRSSHHKAAYLYTLFMSLRIFVLYYHPFSPHFTEVLWNALASYADPFYGSMKLSCLPKIDHPDAPLAQVCLLALYFFL